MRSSSWVGLFLKSFLLMGILLLMASCAGREGVAPSSQAPVKEQANTEAKASPPPSAKEIASSEGFKKVLDKAMEPQLPAPSGPTLAAGPGYTGGVGAATAKAHSSGLPIRPVWGLIRGENTEEAGYGMYTYVLFGTSAAAETSEAFKCYEIVLREIRRFDNAGESKFVKEESNIFYIPAGKGISEDKFGVKDYNCNLGKKILSLFASKIEDKQLVKRLDGSYPGPYLISTKQPLGTITEERFPVLFADLSSHPPAVILEEVRAYKNRTYDKELTGFEFFDSLRLQILRLLVNVDKDIRSVKTAYAENIPR